MPLEFEIENYKGTRIGLEELAAAVFNRGGTESRQIGATLAVAAGLYALAATLYDIQVDFSEEVDAAREERNRRR